MMTFSRFPYLQTNRIYNNEHEILSSDHDHFYSKKYVDVDIENLGLGDYVINI